MRPVLLSKTRFNRPLEISSLHLCILETAPSVWWRVTQDKCITASINSYRSERRTVKQWQAASSKQVNCNTASTENRCLVLLASLQELTARYSHSLLLAMTCPPEQSDSLQEAVLQQACPEARLVSAAGGAHQWEVPKDKVTLSHLFATVQKLASSGACRTLLHVIPCHCHTMPCLPCLTLKDVHWICLIACAYAIAMATAH
jgi:hypothetical protein